MVSGSDEKLHKLLRTRHLVYASLMQLDGHDRLPRQPSLDLAKVDETCW